jgi:hypothetical protein
MDFASLNLPQGERIVFKILMAIVPLKAGQPAGVF